jgi:antitoxin HigA-1
MTTPRMRKTPHPGETLRDDMLPALGLSVTDAAQALDVTRVALSRVLNGRANLWLGMQVAHDLWAAEKVARPKLKRIKPVNYVA